MGETGLAVSSFCDVFTYCMGLPSLGEGGIGDSCQFCASGRGSAKGLERLDCGGSRKGSCEVCWAPVIKRDSRGRVGWASRGGNW
jgi:hypothetical protein